MFTHPSSSFVQNLLIFFHNAVAGYDIDMVIL